MRWPPVNFETPKIPLARQQVDTQRNCLAMIGSGPVCYHDCQAWQVCFEAECDERLAHARAAVKARCVAGILLCNSRWLRLGLRTLYRVKLVSGHHSISHVFGRCPGKLRKVASKSPLAYSRCLRLFLAGHLKLHHSQLIDHEMAMICHRTTQTTSAEFRRQPCAQQVNPSPRPAGRAGTLG